MPDTTDFDIRPSASPRTADERAAILADPGSVSYTHLTLPTKRIV